jgi:hypothetical protein
MMQAWLMLNEVSQETMMVVDPAEHDRLQQAGWLINGTGNLYLTATADTAGVHRLVRSTDQGNDRVFAITPEEMATCLKSGYHEEGTLGFASAAQLKPEMIPVYRFSRNQKHLWLIAKSARPWAEKNGWKAEGVGFWIWPANAP